MSLTDKEKITNFETLTHIQKVQRFIHTVICDLMKRAENHDATKLESPEVEFFAKYTDVLSAMTYGSQEYNDAKAAMKPALDHHYAHNRHHPEHFKKGLSEMNLIDLVEMFCDWKASSQRHTNGNIRKSIEINGDRFNMSPQLIALFENTADYFDTIEDKR
jgi:hypothetical protein